MGEIGFERVMQGLEKEVPGSIVDGPVTDAYWRTRPRIVWLLREVNNGHGWSLSDFLAEKDRPMKEAYGRWKSTYGKVVQVSSGLLNQSPAFTGVPPIDEIKGILKKVAVINISKTAGGNRSNWTELLQRYQQFREVLLGQIDALAPDILIGGNVLSLLADDLALGEPESETASLTVYKSSNRLLLDAYHPGCRMSQEEYYEEIIAAVQAFMP